MYSPFTLNISPMKRLFLINFEKDPDETYIGFEPQWFEDASYGTGLRIIAWRKDGYVDVYQQPGLTVEEKLDVAAKGLADTHIHPMENARFNITPRGVDVAFAFEDKNGRPVKVEVVEKSQKPTNPFALLAPVGSSSTKPSYLPVYFMYGFDFVRRADTQVTISINGRSHKADPFPFPMNGSRVYFMRYSADTFLVDWCPAQSKMLELLEAPVVNPVGSEDNHYTGPNGTQYQLAEMAEEKELPAFAAIRAIHNQHTFEARFQPAFPEITHLPNKASLKGRFTFGAEASAGVVSGEYQVNRSGDQVEVTLHPKDGWEPQPTTLFLKFFFTAIKVFRQWPKTYQWKAKITLQQDAPPYMESKWERV
ncbi:hypothetical protein [Anoxynatronum sibiricum]|uniref:Uncharacterized protein n=1 Tax=Anoxynatronum sibiricum TaxID=210623 RepID=A0ABU9VT60_9CLOT